MDQRHTFADTAALTDLLTTLQKEQKYAAFLIDQNGLSRISGTIESIQNKNAPQLILSVDGISKQIILLDEIVAVNGIFRSDYSEC